MQKSSTDSGLANVILSSFVFLASFYLLLIGLDKHRVLWFGVFIGATVLFLVSHDRLKKVALTLISILPIVNYGFIPHFGYTIFETLAVVIVGGFFYNKSVGKGNLRTQLTYPFLFMLLSLIASTIVAPNVEFALSIILICLIFFFVTKSIAFYLLDEKDLKAVLYCLVIPLIVSALLGVYQAIFGSSEAKLVDDFNPNVISGELGFSRVPGPLNNSLNFGQYLSILISFFIGFLLASRRDCPRSKPLTILSYVALFIGMAALVGTISRTAMAAVVITLIICLFIRYRSRILIAVSVMALSIIVFQAQLADMIGRSGVGIRFMMSQFDFQAGRLDIWKYAFRVFSENPLLGVGTGNLNYASGINGASLKMVPGGHVESVYVSYLVSNGILGLTALVYFLWKGIKMSYDLFKNNSDPLVKSVSFGLFAGFVSSSINMTTNPASLPSALGSGDPTNFYLFWLLLAILMVTAKRTQLLRISQDVQR